MKIIYLHQYFNTPAMNGGTRSYEFARRMVQAGHEVHLITSRRCGEEKAEDWSLEVIEGIYVYWFPIRYANTMGFFERVKAFLRFALESGKKAVQIGGDIIFASSTPLTIAIPAVKAKKVLKVPLVFEVRDLWPKVPIAMGVIKSPVLKWLAKKLEHYAYFNSEHVVALSPDMRDGVLESGYPKARTSVIPNSCDFELFNYQKADTDAFRASFEWLKERPLVLYAGTLGVVNDVSYLVNLAKEMKYINPDVRFLVVGTGIEENKVKDLAIRLQVLNDNFYMMNAMPKTEVAKVFVAATICTSVVANIKELWANSANKVFDSLAAGKPVMINHQGWQSELIEIEQLGLVLSSTPDREAAESLNSFILDAYKIQRVTDNVKGVSVSMFSRDKLASKLIAILEGVVKK